VRRRALLVAALGAPALHGCTRAAGPRFDGGWVGASHTRGHRLRDRLDVAFDGAARERVGVVIVGGGIAGLACARELARLGIDDLLLLELEDEAGGNSRAHMIDGTRCPFGAHYLPLPGSQAHEVRTLLFELGLLQQRGGRMVPDERHLCHSPQERLFFEGAWHDGLLPPAAPASRTVAQYRAFARRVAQVSRALAFALPAQRAAWSAGHDALDAQTFGHWLGREGLDDPHLRWYLDYACRDDYGAGLDTVSAWAGLHYFASRHGFQAPGDDGAEREPLFTWPEGNAWLVQRLAAPLGERIRTGHTVLHVDVQRGGVRVDALIERTQQPVRFDARAVVFATPLVLARRLLSAVPDALARASERCRYAPWLVAHVQLAAPLLERASGAPPSWDNLRYGSPSLGYVSAQHQSLRADQRATVLSAYWALPEGERATLLRDDWRAWAQRVIDDLAVAHPDLPHTVRRVDLVRLGHAMRIPTPGARGDPALRALAAGMPDLQFVHADLAGYSVFEEAYTFGVQAAARIRSGWRA
jgi:phytoene dehydrogenase-like protein